MTPSHSIQLCAMYFICRVRKDFSTLQIRQLTNKYWTARQLPQKTCVLNPRMVRKTEIAPNISQNSSASFVFHEQTFVNLRLVFCCECFSCYSLSLG